MKESSDVVFGPRDDWWNNACLNFTSSEWQLYADGYREGADLLIQHVLNAERSLDTLVYPIVFLYRQCIELTLKQIIRDASVLLRARREMPRGHQLDLLWKDARALIERAFPEQDVWPLDEIADAVQQFAALDASSTAFRYPRDLKGNPSLPGIMHINVAQFHERVRKCVDALDGALCMIRACLDASADHG